VKDGASTLIQGTHYNVSYSDNVNVGQGKIIVTAIEGSGYTGTYTGYFWINRAEQAITVTPNPMTVKYKKTAQFTLTGVQGSPYITYTSLNTSIATVNAQGLVYGKTTGNTTIRIQVAETNNTSAWTADIPLRVIGKEFTKSKTKVTISKKKYTYDGKAKKPAVKKVTYSGKKLKKGKDYKVTYKNNVNAGKGSVIVTGIGKYSNYREIKFTIQKAKSKMKATIDETDILPKEKAHIKVKKNVGEVTFKSSDRDVATVSDTGVVTGRGIGTCTITVTDPGNQNYKKGTAKFTINVGNHNLNDKNCKVYLSQTTYTYDGKEKRPTPTVKYDGVKLKKDRDYTVSYDDNVLAGKGSVILKGKGSYKGTRVVRFKINKAEQKNFKAALQADYIPLNGKAKVSVSGYRGKLSFGCESPSYAKYVGNRYYKGLKETKDGITLTVTASGDDNYKSKTIELWVQVKSD
jgi:hypothetical protein